MAPALALIFAGLDARWKRASLPVTLGSLILLLVAIWAIFFASVEYTYQPIQSPVMFFPLPAFLFIMLYWVRWWAVRPPNTWFEQITAEENA